MTEPIQPAPLIKHRAYQRQVFRHALRRLFLEWARQDGKSFTLASDALDRMMATPGRLVTFISASIVLGGEFLLKEVQIWAKFIELYRLAAKEAGMKLTTTADGLDLDALADLFEHSKLETRLWHSNSVCSRSRVIAPNPDTAVGWTSDIYGDEITRWPNAQAVMEAVIPFMNSNSDLVMRLAGTPPPDDRHWTYEAFLPPQEEWPVNPLGNWFKAPCGIMVHRHDAYDRYAAGFPMFHPDTGDPITPEEDRVLAFDKPAWDRNNALKFLAGGTGAVSMMSLQRAMLLGRGQCWAADITEELVA
jgi:hypothetical protein